MSLPRLETLASIVLCGRVMIHKHMVQDVSFPMPPICVSISVRATLVQLVRATLDQLPVACNKVLAAPMIRLPGGNGTRSPLQYQLDRVFRVVAFLEP